MEPDVLTYQHAAARPPLDDDIGEAGSDEEKFRSVSRGLAAYADPPFHLKCGFLRQAEPPGGPPWPLANGFCDTPGDEAGFADFAVFAEQAAHPWCCGFAGATMSSNGLREARDVIMDSEPTASLRRLHLRTRDAPRMFPTSGDQDSLSFKGASENSEPKVSSLASHEHHTDVDGEEHMVNDMCAASQGTCPTSKPSSQFLVDDSGGPRGLPPSDSFADFCSAATQQAGGETWAHFKDQGDRTQQLLRASFPEMEVPSVSEEDEEEVPSLEALLHPRHLLDCEEGTVERAQPGFWLPHQDAHFVAGLKFQWGSSRANRTLLRCLGVASRNAPNRDCYPEHTVTTSRAQTHTRGPLNQLNATAQPRP
ncbi:uncharacterized protein LOC133486258 isoform X2 [Phyllopteryx taeniolatus]|uniref:uncharacterized protein LOC133486258 isoform X2 n=1 Tax=Phyllopteryx taeniolatus TaxID=161469 RepID=UPI002AD29788|nr:uncharacterized protein LOC133486258 isoform X2 [Phyllopteryx taeniolatus]